MYVWGGELLTCISAHVQSARPDRVSIAIYFDKTILKASAGGIRDPDIIFNGEHSKASSVHPREEAPEDIFCFFASWRVHTRMDLCTEATAELQIDK
jgi:hypothetical protein